MTSPVSGLRGKFQPGDTVPRPPGPPSDYHQKAPPPTGFYGQYHNNFHFSHQTPSPLQHSISSLVQLYLLQQLHIHRLNVYFTQILLGHAQAVFGGGTPKGPFTIDIDPWRDSPPSRLQPSEMQGDFDYREGFNKWRQMTQRLQRERDTRELHEETRNAYKGVSKDQQRALAAFSRRCKAEAFQQAEERRREQKGHSPTGADASNAATSGGEVEATGPDIDRQIYDQKRGEEAPTPLYTASDESSPEDEEASDVGRQDRRSVDNARSWSDEETDNAGSEGELLTTKLDLGKCVELNAHDYDGEDGDCDEEDSASDYEGAGARKMEAGCAFPGCDITAGLLRCVGCREVLYCGKKHQQGDWRAHRPSCKQRKRVQEQDQQKATAAEVVALAAAASGAAAAHAAAVAAATAHAAAARATEAAEAIAAAVAAGEEATATAAAEAAPVTKNQSRRFRKRVRKRQAQEREATRRKHAERFNQVLGRLRQACERRKRRCKEQRRNRRRLRKGLECYFKRRRLREAQRRQGKDHQQVELFDQVLGGLRQAYKRRKQRCKEQRRKRRRLRKELERYFERRRRQVETQRQELERYFKRRRRQGEAQRHRDKDRHRQQLGPTLRVLGQIGDWPRKPGRRQAVTTTTTKH